MKVDLGCGKNKMLGYYGIDKIATKETDMVCDFDEERIRLKDDSCTELFSRHTLEHCKNIVHVMAEIYRICKDGARVTIIVPYGTSHQWIQDPTHQTCFNEDTFRKYFCNPEYVASFSDYGIRGFFKEEEVFIKGKDILHLELHAILRVKKQWKTRKIKQIPSVIL